MIEIEKGIPMPGPRRGNGHGDYRFDELEVGDSVLLRFSAEDPSKDEYKFRNLVSSYNTGRARRDDGKKLSSRKEHGRGIRVWRVN